MNRTQCRLQRKSTSNRPASGRRDRPVHDILCQYPVISAVRILLRFGPDLR
jgi:hypothetical protein